MTILHLEDRYAVSSYLEELLQKLGHTTHICYSVLDAQSVWEEEKVDCIIADLNLDPEGLTLEEIKKTQQGILTGWIWLKEYVFKNKTDTTNVKDMKPYTVIYSEYISELKKAVSLEELDGIKLIQKKGSTSPVDEVLKLVKEVENKMINNI